MLATGGEEGGDAEARRAETQRSAALLGIARVVELGYRDSGMAGDAANDAADSLWSAPVAEAAAAVAAVCLEEAAGVLVGYDDHGVYGHPDHVRVQRVALAAEAAQGCRSATRPPSTASTCTSSRPTS